LILVANEPNLKFGEAEFRLFLNST